ncbi:MAG: glycoside hydrolase family 97 catalytic domain-containing protein [Verrucomicrobiales bacterium]
MMNHSFFSTLPSTSTLLRATFRRGEFSARSQVSRLCLSVSCVVLTSLLFAVAARGDVFQLAASDSSPSIAFEWEEGILTYSVFDAETENPVVTAPISITINGTRYPEPFSVVHETRSSHDSVITPTVALKSSSIPDFYQQLTLDFGGGVTLVARAYPDGVAFRWVSHLGEGDQITNDEEFAFEFQPGTKAYLPESTKTGFLSHHEHLYPLTKVEDVTPDYLAPPPFLAELGEGRYLHFSDVDLRHFPGLWLCGTPTDRPQISTTASRYPKSLKEVDFRTDGVDESFEYLARTPGDHTYPWRAFLLTDAPGLLTSNFYYQLAAPCVVDETSWIKPGKVAWDWWNAWGLTGVSFEAGVNNETYKHYIDFAAENDLGYIILDEGWSEPGRENLLKVVDAIDVPQLVRYGQDKGVGIILWSSAIALEHDLSKVLDTFEEWGVAGIKMDFAQRDDQLMVEFYERVAREAAKRQLLVNFHGGLKPTGFHRTWPNVITYESVMGLEQSKWSLNANPETSVLLPFVRMPIGPMDYTPGAMRNFNQRDFRPIGKNPGSQGTRCHQLAMFVAFESPLQMLADSPSQYRKEPECLEFLEQVPVTWDETVPLTAEVGRHVSLARRHGDIWFIGGLTDWERSKFTTQLDFLPEGKSYQMTLWQDGINAHRNATDFATSTQVVTRDSWLQVETAPGGGFAAILKEL